MQLQLRSGRRGIHRRCIGHIKAVAGISVVTSITHLGGPPRRPTEQGKPPNRGSLTNAFQHTSFVRPGHYNDAAGRRESVRESGCPAGTHHPDYSASLFRYLAPVGAKREEIFKIPNNPKLRCSNVGIQWFGEKPDCLYVQEQSATIGALPACPR